MFFLGNVISAYVHSIWGLVIGRFLQGSGAISGVCMAFLSDLISKKNYAKSIAAIGVSFALSFLLAMIIGPIIVQFFGFFSIFSISSYFSVICVIIIFFVCPNIKHISSTKKTKYLFRQILIVVFNQSLFKSYLGIFFLHFLLMIHFMILPNYFELSGVILNDQWKIYSTTIIISFFILFLFLFFCKINLLLNNIIEICIIFLLFSEIIFLTSHNNLIFLIIALQIFFVSFNFLEVFLPVNLRNQNLNNYKSVIMSIYSTSQFLGISFGGVISGWLCSCLTTPKIFLFEVLSVFFWLSLHLFLKIIPLRNNL
nr:MFS transporter [Buchnera aphidicola]